MAAPSHRRLYSYAHSASIPSHVSFPLSSRPSSASVPPLPHSSSRALPRLYPYHEPVNKHSSSMIDLSSQVRRCPPVDPRRARRHGRDFGFSRSSTNTPLPVSLSSIDSLVLPVVQESARLYNSTTTSGSVSSSLESDCDTSSVQEMRFDFPEPPPISPLLRRMKSSPLFTMDDVSIAQRSERALHTGFTRNQSPDAFSDIPSDSTLSPLADISPDAMPQELDLDHHPERRFILESANWSPASLPRPSYSGYIANDDYRSNVLPSPCLTTTPSASCPPLSRKVSKMRTLKFPQSVGRLDARTEKPKIYKSIVRGQSASMDFHKSYSMSFFGSPDKAAARPRAHGHQSPITSNRTPQRATSVTSPLGRTKASLLNHGGKNASHHTPPKSFVRQTSSSTGLYGMSSDLCREEFKSFMDISPERGALRLGASKDTVKKFLTRASTIFEWGRLKRSWKQ